MKTTRFAPWLLALLSFAQCTHGEAVEETAPKAAAAPPPATSAAAALAKDDVPEPAVRVPIDGLPAFGDASALVTLVVFTDFECPYCAKAAARVEALKADYGDKLRVVVASNPLPFHPHAALAGRAFLAANEQGKGEAMFQKLFALTTAEKTLDDAALDAAAAEIGLDVAAFDAARKGPSTAAAQTTADVLSARLFVRGTPTFFINGRRLVGARPIETFRAAIDEEMIRASRLRTNDVYAAVMRDAPDPTPPKPEVPEDADKVYDVDVAGAPARGPASAKTTVVLFADFECPFSVRAEKTVRELEAQRPGQIRVVFKQMPLPMHAHAKLAAKASFAAERQNKFWEYHDVLVQHRTELERADLLKYAADLGLNPARFEADLDDPATDARVDKDVAQAKSLGVLGTPAAFINGHRLTGAQPLPMWMGMSDLAATGR